ncbi:uncharacterized protein LOC113383213 [Ctenocephalides felis]|uniref:uncharacterized protein LOC113383213 n=1 Tax=Ctenocephalides felis TaxID=7515 RepID=UPI000E6E2E09|nr:uncharacterized protein LOC113383213 [Ctenocephalides felis]
MQRLTDTYSIVSRIQKWNERNCNSLCSFLELCLDLKINCNNLHTLDRHAILRYAFNLFPTFVKLLYKGLKCAWDSFKTLSPSHKQELAQYVIPEIEGFLNSFTTVFAHAKLAVEKLIEIVEAESTSEGASRSKVISRNKCDYGYNELTILKILHSKITYLMLYGIDKRECFDEMSQNEQYRAVTHNFDMISEEFPLFIVRLQEVISTLDDKYDPYEFNFGFKLTTTTVAGILQRIITNVDIAEKLTEQMCFIMQRERFTQIMKSLGILKPKLESKDNDSTSNMLFESSSKTSWSGNRNKNQPELNCQLVLGEYLLTSPSSDHSMLARKITRLLYNEMHTDMEFIIVSTREDKSPLSEIPCPIESNLNSPEAIVIYAHRVIVAARCPWFRRALLSGMIEDRNRKIVIYDTSPNVFKEFLHYLYGNGVSQTCISNQDALSELMLLADRYEVDELKKITEFILITGVDDDSAIFLLSISDQINAEALKATCLEYIAINPTLMNSDLFKKLSEDLQNETAEFVKWKTPSRRANKFRDRMPCMPPSPPRCTRSDSMNMQSQVQERDTFGDLEEMMLHGDHSSILSLDSLSNDSDEHLESCLALIRDIVGDAPSNETLIRVILAADYDINRAVNFFYSE